MMKAKKSFGQHFLNNEHIAEQIALSLSLSGSYQKVLEIGPGRGVLTKYLLEQPYQLFAVEADRDMISYLQKYYPALKDRLIPADFLKLELNVFFPDESFAIIGNFPYNISSQILIKMLEHRTQIPELVGMFQKEVAERVIAGPGSKTYGVLSVLVQAYYAGEYLFTVDKGNFSPPPKVQSGVIRLIRKESLELGCDERLFKSIIKQSFGQRRKMLRNTMKSYLKGDPFLDDEFFNQRPEQLSVADFIKLTQEVEKRRTK